MENWHGCKDMQCCGIAVPKEFHEGQVGAVWKMRDIEPSNLRFLFQVQERHEGCIKLNDFLIDMRPITDLPPSTFLRYVTCTSKANWNVTFGPQGWNGGYREFVRWLRPEEIHGVNPYNRNDHILFQVANLCSIIHEYSKLEIGLYYKHEKMTS